ncbi:hypothetical protein B0T10DRAFT_30738 [Thelonectria olida]|uniref:Uncharacterized protein n=1 Tax=Thelonectria olida TaxID=1576542 RepID=A0A9P9AX69_9HYPO|nr:hypothetical protein B0T10DRAFT_30738 [Thelonectria olida]
MRCPPQSNVSLQLAQPVLTCIAIIIVMPAVATYKLHTISVATALPSRVSMKRLSRFFLPYTKKLNSVPLSLPDLPLGAHGSIPEAITQPTRPWLGRPASYASKRGITLGRRETSGSSLSLDVKTERNAASHGALRSVFILLSIITHPYAKRVRMTSRRRQTPPKTFARVTYVRIAARDPSNKQSSPSPSPFPFSLAKR